MYKRTYNQILKTGILDGHGINYMGKTSGLQVEALDEDGDPCPEKAEELSYAILEQFPHLRAKIGMGGMLMFLEKPKTEREKLIEQNRD